MNLLQQLDALGVGLETSIARAWENRVARVEASSTWRLHPEARRMAMLAVYQVPAVHASAARPARRQLRRYGTCPCGVAVRSRRA